MKPEPTCNIARIRILQHAKGKVRWFLIDSLARIEIARGWATTKTEARRLANEHKRVLFPEFDADCRNRSEAALKRFRKPAS